MIINNRGIELTLPESQTAEKEQKGVKLEISKNEEFFLDSKPVPFELLPAKIGELAQTNESITIILSADKTTPYERVIDTMDSIRLGGIYNILLEVQKER